MHSRLCLLAMAAGALATQITRPPLIAQAQDALIGQVTSSEEGLMEGVLVSAKRTGATWTTTVVSDRQGRYRFPRARLEPGSYAISIRAIGYDLDGAGTVSIAPSSPTPADLKLKKAADVAAQLTNTEWLDSFPGTDDQKGSVRGCAHCHTLELVTRSRHNPDAFTKVVER